MFKVLRLITPAVDPAVTLDEAKRHLRVDDTGSDDLITAYIAAAEQSLDYVGRAFKTASYALDLGWREAFDINGPAFWYSLGYDPISLPKPPLKTVTAVKARAGDGTVTTLGTSLYTVTTTAGGLGYVTRAYGQTWPSVRGDIGSLSIEFTAGYDDDVPAALRAAVLLIVGSLYENRSAASPVAMTALPVGVDALVAPYRIFNL